MDKIEELLTRGVANIIPGNEELREALKAKKKLNVYLGIDPTAPHIHLGHTVPLRKLQAFVEQGSNVILLIGDFTALVGDTSDKESERPILTEEEIKQNFQTYKKQAEKILDFSKVKIRHNSEWLSKLTYKDLLKLKQQFSLNDFISRELIRKRLDDGKRVRLDETEYPIMQGYDSYFMDTDVQLGGTDQTFNMQAGRTLQKAFRNKNSFIMTNVFLDGTDGRKMSKTGENTIWLDEKANDMYAKVMAIRDNLIIQYFTLATSISISEIKEIGKEVKKNPMNAKKKLAFEIVKELYSERDAKEAEKHFKKTVQEKQLPEDVLEIELDKKESAVDALIGMGAVTSKTSLKRLIEQKGITLDGRIVANIDSIKDGVLKIGKRRFLKIKKSS